jgi:competence protein ComEC
VPDPPVWIAIALAFALVAAAVTLRLRSRWFIPAGACALGLFAVVAVAPFQPEIAPRVLELTAVDVGQGEALVITTPEGKVLLMDVGGIPVFGRRQKPKLDIGEDVVSPYLWWRRFQHADVVATSHAHEDHVGGLGAIVENFRPSEIWTGAMPEESEEAAVIARAAASGVRVRHRRAGETFDFGGARFEVLAPSPDYQPATTAHNNDSLTLRICYGNHSFLLTGDIERQVEEALVAGGALSNSTVLKVAHHGSKSSTTAEFLEAVRPGFAIVSAGYGNMFRHPHTQVLERLAVHNTGVLRTDLDGLVTIRTDGRRITVDTMARHRMTRRLVEPFQSW